MTIEAKPAPAKPPDFDRRLAALNQSVRVEWNAGLGVWEIQERGRVTGQWRYVMLWAVLAPPRAPQYVPLPSPEEIMRRLHEIDVERLGSTPSSQWGALCADMDEKRRDWLAGHLAEMDEAGREYAEDMHARGNGIRQTFAPGYIRSRVGLASGSQNMRDFVAVKTARPKLQPISPFARNP